MQPAEVIPGGRTRIESCGIEGREAWRVRRTWEDHSFNIHPLSVYYVPSNGNAMVSKDRNNLCLHGDIHWGKQTSAQLCPPFHPPGKTATAMSGEQGLYYWESLAGGRGI